MPACVCNLIKVKVRKSDVEFVILCKQHDLKVRVSYGEISCSPLTVKRKERREIKNAKDTRKNFG